MEKICGICRTSKPLTVEFFATRIDRNGWQSICRQCQKEYRRKHYLENKQKYIDKAAQWRKEQLIIFYNWMKDKSCLDCGINDIRVLEFDHLNDKSFNISEVVGSVKLEVLMKEIAKCDIVCKNCHAIRTATRSNWYGYMQ